MSCTNCQDLTSRLTRIEKDVKLILNSLEEMYRTQRQVSANIEELNIHLGKGKVNWIEIATMVASILSVLTGIASIVQTWAQGAYFSKLIKYSNDILYASTQANIKLNEQRKYLNDTLYASTQANIKLDRSWTEWLRWTAAFKLWSDSVNLYLREIFKRLSEFPETIKSQLQSQLQQSFNDLGSQINNSTQEIINNSTNTIIREIGSDIQSIPNSIIPEVKKVNGEIINLGGRVKEYQKNTDQTIQQSLRVTVGKVSELNRPKDYTSLLDGIAKSIVPLPGLINGLGAKIDSMPNSNTFRTNVTNAAAAGTCQTLQPGGCMNRAFGGVNGKLDRLNAGLNGLDLAATAQVNRKMDDALLRLGPQIPGGLSGGIGNILNNLRKFQDLVVDKFNKLWKATGMDRVLNFLIAAAAIHNAAMLSRDLGVTLIETTESVIRAFQYLLPDFLKDPEGKPLELDLQEFFSDKMAEFLKRLLGVDNYVNLRKTWLRANRIISTAANMLDAMRSMSNAIIQGLNVVGGWVAKGFNGIQSEGLVSDRTWPWMDQTPNFGAYNHITRYTSQLENYQDAADSVDQLAQAPVQFVENATQLTKESQDLVKLVNDKGLEKEYAEIEEEARSKSPEIDDDDLLPSD